LRNPVLPALAGLIAVCGGTPASQRGPMIVTYYQEGEARTPEISPSCRERIPEILDELVGQGEPVRLLVSEERIDEIRATVEAVEVLLPETRRFEGENGNAFLARRFLVPLGGESWVGDEDHPRATVFVGEEGYQSGPLMAPTGWPLAQELRACARGSSIPGR